MWIARNRNNALYLFVHKPYRNGNVWESDTEEALLVNYDYGDYPIQWKDEPIEVVILPQPTIDNIISNPVYHTIYDMGKEDGINYKNKLQSHKGTISNMENIFEGAKFGDKFQTRDGRPAVFVNWSQYMDKAVLYVKERDMEDYGIHYYFLNGECYDGNGNPAIDIVLKCEHTIKAFANGVTNKEMRDLLSQYPDDAMVAVECCNVRTMKYCKEDNSIRID